MKKLSHIIWEAYRKIFESEQKIYFKKTREVWDDCTCEKICNTEKSFYNKCIRGLVQLHASTYPKYGNKVFNGGFMTHDEEWYAGYNNAFPIIPEKYCFFCIPSLGIVLDTKENGLNRGLSAIDLDEMGFVVNDQQLK